MAEQVQVEGLAQLQSSLRQLARELPTIAPPAAGAAIGREAVMRAPKRSGRLAASFSDEVTDGAQVLSFGTEYAAAVHFGVGARPGMRGPHNIRPSMYLFGAIDSTQAQWEGEYQTALENAVDKVRGA